MLNLIYLFRSEPLDSKISPTSILGETLVDMTYFKHFLSDLQKMLNLNISI